MPTIVACFKWVIDEDYIREGPSGEIDLSSVSYKLSDYDRNAIEEAVRLRDEHGGTVIAATIGVPEATKGIKDALSRGPDRAVFAADGSFRELEPAQTAALLAELVGARIGDYDLILCGEGSSDLYAQQVGPRLAEKLGIPCVCYAHKISLEGGRLIAERRVEEAVEVVETSLPALVTVAPDINSPRIPGVKDTLMASRKPVETFSADELSPVPAARIETVELKAARLERNCEMFGAEPGEIVRFADALRRRSGIA